MFKIKRIEKEEGVRWTIYQPVERLDMEENPIMVLKLLYSEISEDSLKSQLNEIKQSILNYTEKKDELQSIIDLLTD